MGAAISFSSFNVNLVSYLVFFFFSAGRAPGGVHCSVDHFIPTETGACVVAAVAVDRVDKCVMDDGCGGTVYAT